MAPVRRRRVRGCADAGSLPLLSQSSFFLLLLICDLESPCLARRSVAIVSSALPSHMRSSGSGGGFAGYWSGGVGELLSRSEKSAFRVCGGTFSPFVRQWQVEAVRWPCRWVSFMVMAMCGDGVVCS